MPVAATNSSPLTSPYGVVVKGADGKFRVWRDGSWQELPAGPTPAAPAAAPVPPPPQQPQPQPQAPAFAGPQAANFFSATEEDEARRVAQRLDTAAGHKRYGIRKIVSHVAAKLPAPLPAGAPERLTPVALTFLRGTRSAVDFSAALVRGQADGGVGLTAETAATVVAAMTAIGARIRTEGGEVIDEGRVAPAPLGASQPAPASPGAAAPVAREQSLTPPPQVPVPVAKPAPKAAPKPSVPPQPAVPPKAAPEPEPKPVVTPPPASVPPLWRRPIGARPTAVRPPVETSRPQLADVRHPEVAARPHAVGPIEELKVLDLETYRYLGATPADRSARIVEKVNALGQESLARRAEGVAAWRGSEVYTTYRQIGIESMHTGRPVAEVAADRERRGEPTLSEAEFNAIADLNQQLRF